MAELDSRYEVKSVVRAITILEALEDSLDGLTVTDVAKIVGLSKSTAFATLQTLRAYGLVSDKGEGATRRYRLGLALVRLGQQAATQTSVADVAQPILRLLTEETGLTARVAVLEDDWAVVVGRSDSRTAVRLDLRMGQREWPHCTGVGKALLSALPEPEIRALVTRVGMPARTPHTITDPDVLVAVLARARAEGFCIDDEEDAEGIMCVAAPAVDGHGNLLGAISVTGLKADSALSKPRNVGRAVHAAAMRLAELVNSRSYQLGDNP
jgi:IclR family acetate operon transcriptional repressor